MKQAGNMQRQLAAQTRPISSQWAFRRINGSSSSSGRSSCRRSAGGSRRALQTFCATAAPQLAKRQRLLYDAVVFDMDGTLTTAHIDFVDMRQRTGIPVGDLFVAMESWEEAERIKASMDVILEIEAEAAKGVSGKEGLMELLQLLRESDVQVGLVTRNTNNSVDAFFGLIGQEWRSLFSQLRTREFKFVKPDKRLLLDVAQSWQLHPGRLLMVGDSLEDIECGNSAGTATCLIAGGGNGVGSSAGPPPGAIPTFAVNSLTQLRQFLLDTAPTSDVQGSGSSSSSADSVSSVDLDSLGLLGWSLRSSTESESEDDEAAPPLLFDPSTPGAPAPGLDFLDFLEARGALTTASTSFPRMGAAAGGLQACVRGGGDWVVHVGMQDGALTKMMASKGLRCWGVDADIAAGVKRGLRCVEYVGRPLAAGSLAAAAAVVGGPVDAVLVYTAPAQAEQGLGSADCLADAALGEFATLLKQGGRLCCEVPVTAGSSSAEVAVQAQLQAAGFEAVVVQHLPAAGGTQRLRLVARKPVTGRSSDGGC